MNYKAYDKYKDSGINWLAEIPEEWEVKKIKHVSKVYSGNSIGDNLKANFENIEEESSPYISTKDIDLESSQINYENGLRIPIYLNNFKIAPKNSTLLCIEGGSAGKKMAFLNQDSCFVNKLACFEVNNSIVSKYNYYFLRSQSFKEQFRLSISGMIGGVSISSIVSFNIPIPPFTEQKAIADFLDCKTKEIDNLIAKKEELLKLLPRQLDALITNTVTKGLNPSSRIKDSGLDWLSKIPATWEVKKIRYVGSFQNGVSNGSDYFGAGSPFVSYGDVYNNFSLPKDVKGLAMSSDIDKERYSVEEGDVFFTRTSETAEDIGTSSICLNTIKDAVFSGFLIRFRPKKEVLFKNFSQYYFRSNITRFFFVKEMNIVTRVSLILKSIYNTT